MAVTATGYSIKHTAAGDASTGRYYVKYMYVNGNTAKTDVVQVKDGAGTIVIPSTELGLADDAPFQFPIERFLDGIETDALTAGTAVYVLG